MILVICDGLVHLENDTNFGIILSGIPIKYLILVGILVFWCLVFASGIAS